MITGFVYHDGKISNAQPQNDAPPNGSDGAQISPPLLEPTTLALPSQYMDMNIAAKTGDKCIETHASCWEQHHSDTRHPPTVAVRWIDENAKLERMATKTYSLSLSLDDRM
jgi:hypothetical protein